MNFEAGSSHDAERGLDRELMSRDLLRKMNERAQPNAENTSTFSQQLLRDLGRFGQELEDLQKELGDSPELRTINERYRAGEIMTPEQLKSAEQEAKKAVAKAGKKMIGQTVNSKVDEKLGYSESCSKFIKDSTSLKSASQQIRDIRESLREQASLKEREDKIGKRPQGDKLLDAYIFLLQRDMANGPAQKGREFILDYFEKSFGLVEKAPKAVQNSFLEEVTKAKIDKPEKFQKVAEQMNTAFEDLAKEYKDLLDPKIFGVKPAAEFEDYFRNLPNLEKMKKDLGTLKSEYIPERQNVQRQFEQLPKDVTKEHQENWHENLGCSERKGLLAALKQVEHQRTNPLAKQFLKMLTDHPEEVASKELAQLTEKFIGRGYAEQELVLKAYELTELEERQELTRRFKELPENTREKNKATFFSYNKAEKIEHLKILEAGGEGEENTVGAILETELGMQATRQAFNQAISGTKKWQDFATMDAAALMVKQSTERTGEKDATARQEQRIGEAAGTRAQEKAEVLHEATGGTTTVDAKSGTSRRVHTVDMERIQRGGLTDETSEDIRRGLLYRLPNDRNTDENEVNFVNQPGDAGSPNNIMDLAKNHDQRDKFAQLGMELMQYVVGVVIEQLTGQQADDTQLEKAADVHSRQLLGIQKDVMRQQLRHTGLSTEILEQKKAA